VESKILTHLNTDSLAQQIEQSHSMNTVTEH